MTEQQQQHAVPGSDYLLSLTSLVGKPIKDIGGFVTKEFGDPVFEVARVIFEDGTELHMEGEHDLPYLCSDESIPGLSDETLKTLHDDYEDGPGDDDEEEDEENDEDEE